MTDERDSADPQHLQFIAEGDLEIEDLAKDLAAFLSERAGKPVSFRLTSDPSRADIEIVDVTGTPALSIDVKSTSERLADARGKLKRVEERNADVGRRVARMRTQLV